MSNFSFNSIGAVVQVFQVIINLVFFHSFNGMIQMMEGLVLSEKCILSHNGDHLSR